jgi:uncharacterized phage protein gp47/JayE
LADYGLTAAGWVGKPYTDTLAEIEADERARLYEGLDLSEKTVLGNLNAVFALQAAEVWEALGAIAGGLDPDKAPEVLLVGLGKLTGVIRGGQTSGEALLSVTTVSAVDLAPGGLTVAHQDVPGMLWRNVYQVTTTGAGTLHGVLVRAVLPGAGYYAAPGELSVLAPAVMGVTAVTNPAAATPGQDVESVEAFRLRREQSLSRQGSATTSAIRAEILSGGDGTGVPGVQDCRVLENDTDFTDSNGLPAKSILVLVYDGPEEAAADTDIGEAVLRAKGAGVRTYGAIDVEAEDPDGQLRTVWFDRMTGVRIRVAVTVTGTAFSGDVQAAVVAYGEALPQGATVSYNQVISAVLTVPGVTDVTLLTLRKDDASPVSANLAIAFDEKALFTLEDVTVT